MGPEQVFLVCNNGVLPAWLLLAVAPGWRFTQRLVHALWIPALLALVYVWAFATGTTPEDGDFFTLAGVMALFTSPHAMLAGWVHYLAFDLFVGAWEVRDARRHGIHHAFVVPCLFFTLMLGPVGLLLYLGVRFALTRETSLEEAPA
ncbi:MAG: ABA4-like family protein [Myxococcota bacterium]